MLLAQLREARLNGDDWLAQTSNPDAKNVSGPHMHKMTRLSIAPSFLVHPSTKNPASKRRNRNVPSSERLPKNTANSKRMKNADMSFARLVPAEKFPASLINDRFVSGASPWDEPPATPPTSDCAGHYVSPQLDLDSQLFPSPNDPFAAPSRYTPNRELYPKFFPTTRIRRERSTPLLSE